MNIRSIATLTAYVATIPAANLLVTHFGALPVGFGLMAPAGVFMVGIALVLRDLAHEMTNRAAILVAIGIGTLISYLLGAPAFAELVQGTVWANLATSTRIAFASAASFLLAELADFAVYGRLRRKGLLAALTGSNVVGLVLDSLLFLWLAFGSLEFLSGQIVAKFEMTVLAGVLLAGLVRYRTAHNPPVVGDSCRCTVLQRGLCGHCAHDLCEDCDTCAGAGHTPHECKALA